MGLLEAARKDFSNVSFANITSLKLYNETTHCDVNFIMHIGNKYK
jgi:hypothetical protein